MEQWIDSFRGDEPGFVPLVGFESSLIGIVNPMPGLFLDNISSMQRHLETDEVFVLLRGEGVLFTGGNGDSPSGIDAAVMEKCVVYRIKKGIWHTQAVNVDTKILIIENAGTTPDNSPRINLTEEQCECLRDLAVKHYSD